MCLNSSADAPGIYGCYASFPFEDRCPDRLQQPVAVRSFKSAIIRAQGDNFTPMDELSLHYSYLNLQDNGSLIPINSAFCSELPNATEHQSFDVQIHAPVPSSGHSPVFMDPDYVYNNVDQTLAGNIFYTDQGHFFDSQQICYPVPCVDSNFSNDSLQQWQVGHFDTAAPVLTQETFLTPSELRLAELEAKSTDAHIDDTNLNGEGRVESASKARRRAMARRIGFNPTDPDIITPHEKKRHYLECLEQYVMYLHEQFELIGVAPDSFEQVAPHKGLSSKSIRTLLVHMENTTRKLHIRTQAEEQKYTVLTKEVIRLQNSTV